MRYLSFLSLVIVTVACAPKETSREKLTRELDEYFKEELPADEPGGAILIAEGDSIIFSKGYGLADLNSKEPVSPKTLFNLGSISKTFVANAILILQEQGRLSIDDSLYKYFPIFKNKTIAQKIKIKHLLTHTSGLPDNRPVARDSVFYLSATDPANWHPVTQTDTLVFEPGTRYEYSNPAFNGLALIVEQVSRMKWQEFVRKNIFEPSGMTTSTITDGPYPERGVSHGYVSNNGEWKEYDYGEYPTFAAAGNGGVWSSVEELFLYERALHKATFLKPESISQSRTVFVPSNWSGADSPHIGWSWFIGKTDSGLKTIGHDGDQGGFLSSYITIPEMEIQIVILCNTPRDREEFERKVIEGVLKMSILPQRR